MKRLTALILAMVMVLALPACGSQSAAPAENAPQATSVPTAAPVEEAQRDEPAEEADVNADESKILIVYFSPANTDSVDAVSGATPRVGELSSVEHLAQIIGGQINAEPVKIVPAEAYPIDYNDTANQAKSEQDQDARPAFQLDVNPEKYDVIFIGYPVWWYHLPMIMQSFFDTYDLSGKTIIPFNTHAGSRDGGTYREIAALEPDATVLDGLAVAGERASGAEKDVLNWLAGLGY